ncbi:hypothetical protein [Clostridium guangxiense]|uniref:hypothetical protein n=1 Tax=Clostridium guangxiense TaxID=1662055 RepID=UPI001E2B6290|nr:hypothetical protein [Clostridium guangxiense]MCD2345110.1 hypothetical protein [Clostridium guangxiense]
MNFNKNNKVKFIVMISIITLIFIIIGIFMFSKFAYRSKDKLDVKKNIKTVKQEKQNQDNKVLEIKVVGNDQREKKLKEFADKYKDHGNSGCTVNSSAERRTQNGEFYIDNAAGDFYSKNITNLDDSNRIEDRLKEAANDMKNVYNETNSFKDDAQRLNSYLSKGDNKSRFCYLYGISSINDLKDFVSKLFFLKDSRVKYGVLQNIKKIDNNNINFQFQVKTNNNTSQTFNVDVNFADERAILNIRIS